VVQVDPIKPTLKAPEPKRLKLECDGLLSNFGFKFNLRRYNMAEIPALGSIMHLFLGIDATGLPDLDPSHLAVIDWERPLGDPQNVVTIFIPTVLDPEVRNPAPPTPPPHPHPTRLPAQLAHPPHPLRTDSSPHANSPIPPPPSPNHRLPPHLSDPLSPTACSNEH